MKSNNTMRTICAFANHQRSPGNGRRSGHNIYYMSLAATGGGVDERRTKARSAPRYRLLFWTVCTALVTVRIGENSWLISWISLLGWLAAALPK